MGIPRKDAESGAGSNPVRMGFYPEKDLQDINKAWRLV